MAGILHVWLRGEHCAELEKLRNGKLRLRFDPHFIATYGVGTPSLSLSITNTTKRLEGPAVDRFFDNLLPENPLRATLERQHSVSPYDTFGLLEKIGLDCAGAIQFTLDEDAPLSGSVHPLTPAEVTRLVEDTPTLNTPDDLPLSASLGGIQPKLLLTRDLSGEWFWPAYGAPSNVIVKPDPSNSPVADLLELEHWTLELARHAGVPAARTELHTFGSRLALVVDRFDRYPTANSRADVRVHQEDFAQALSVSVAAKYEPASAQRSRLAELVALAAPFAVHGFELDLLAQITFNAVIGNGDAHSKNYSVMLSPEGEVSLAPLYDAAPVFLASSAIHGFGHVVGGQSSLRHIAARHLVAEAESWGVSSELAQGTIQQVCNGVLHALENSPLSDLTIPTELGDTFPLAVRNRAEQFARDL